MTPLQFSRERKLLVINVLEHGSVRTEELHFGGIRFSISEHRIGWDFETAAMLIRQNDGYVDGIALSGVQRKFSVRKTRFIHPLYLKLLRSAVRTPLYLSDDLREFFADWTLSQVAKSQPQLFNGKKILFHCALVSQFMPKLKGQGSELRMADALLLAGTPVLLKSERALEAFVRMMRATFSAVQFASRNLHRQVNGSKTHSQLDQWIRESDVFVTFTNLLRHLPSLDALEGKILVVDYLSSEMREKLEQARVAQIIEFTPESLEFTRVSARHFSVLAALIDQKRIVEDSSLSFEEYLLKWIQESNIKPNRIRSSKKMVKRCAFIIHPLSQGLLCKNSGIPYLDQSPKSVKKLVESVGARVPIFKYGTLSGAVSELNGQEVICDLYAMPATPKQLLSLPEEFVYKRLIEGAKLAQRNGAEMVGLGAYTKVVGDAGVSVARGSPIPVTNGNSYSVSATLAAAHVMVERMGLIPVERRNNRVQAKVMIIGATGSIGRVCALLIGLVFEEVILVATRPDKLLEVRQEILDVSPQTRVSVTTNPNQDLPTTDLVITATSNQSGEILDIERVKPGAVICDCSRPLDITPEEAARRPDVLVVESGEILLPGEVKISCDIGLPKPTVYACLAETVLLTMENRIENFSLSKRLSMERVKEIHRIGRKHGAKLSTIYGPNGVVTDEIIEATRKLALERMKTWPHRRIDPGSSLMEAQLEVHGLRLGREESETEVATTSE